MSPRIFGNLPQFLRLALICWGIGLFVFASTELRAQDGEARTAGAVTDPAGSARLMFEGKQVASVGFSLRNDGPRFALAPIARVLGVELRIGPLGDSHTLVFDDKKVLLGPEDPTVVTVTPEGRLREEITTLRLAPIKTARGLEVPLELLERTLGDELGYELEWSFRELQLVLQRRELRELVGSINLVHQYRISTVEIEFSESPRFRFEALAGAVEVRLVGDSLTLEQAFSRPADPLVTNITAAPTHIRIDLEEQAVSGQPRLVPRGSKTSLVIEIYRQSGPKKQTGDLPPSRSVEPLTSGLRRIVLDPGHGGKETGALGQKGAVESQLTLLMARLLKTRLEQRLPVQVELTRTTDVDVPHDSRVAFANQMKADLFISLHFNSYRGSRATGAETFFLSREASDQLAAQLAERENASGPDTAGGEPSGDDLGLILWDLAQSYHLTESQRFASLVQEELNQTLGIRNRGVRQAPFRVLMGADMPAVLVELGFLSNPQEEAKVLSPAYQAQLADALVRAVSRFKTQLEARQSGSERSESDRSLPSTGGGP